MNTLLHQMIYWNRKTFSPLKKMFTESFISYQLQLVGSIVLNAQFEKWCFWYHHLVMQIWFCCLLTNWWITYKQCLLNIDILEPNRSLYDLFSKILQSVEIILIFLIIRTRFAVVHCWKGINFWTKFCNFLFI